MSNRSSKAIVALFFALLAASVAAVIVFGHQKERDAITNCPISTTTKAASFIVLDQSDQFERGDAERTRQYVKQILERLDTSEKLVVLELNPDQPFEPKVLFERCAPTRPGEWNILFDDVNAMKEEVQAFQADFWRLTSAGFERRELPKSPILETLAYLSERKDFRESHSKSVFLFSDLIQHYATLNFYRAVPRPEDVSDSSLRSNAIDLRNASFFLILVSRRDQWNHRPLVAAFWDRWLRDRGASTLWTPDSNGRHTDLR